MRPVLFLLTAGLFLSPAAARAADPPKGWEFVGRTQAAATVAVRPRVAGYLTRVAVKEGAAVKKGDLLAEVDPQPYRIDLEAAQARAKAAEARLKSAKVKADNTRKLAQANPPVVGQSELALNVAAAEEAEAGLAAAKADAERARLHLAWTQVKAPTDGRVSLLSTAEGNVVVADWTVILTVVATDPLRVSFNVPETILLQLRRDGLADPGKLGVAVGFAGDDGYPNPAKLDSIGAEVDPDTGTVRFRATLANPKGLFSPGMSARVRLTPAK